MGSCGITQPFASEALGALFSLSSRYSNSHQISSFAGAPNLWWQLQIKLWLERMVFKSIRHLKCHQFSTAKFTAPPDAISQMSFLNGRKRGILKSSAKLFLTEDGDPANRFKLWSICPSSTYTPVIQASADSSRTKTVNTCQHVKSRHKGLRKRPSNSFSRLRRGQLIAHLFP